MVMLGALIATDRAAAAGDRSAEPRSEIRLGTMLAQFGSDLRLDGAGGVGSNLDLEDRLGMNKDVTDFRLDLRYRMTPRQRLDLSYYELSRSGRRVTDRILTIGDRVFDIGTDLESEFDTSIYKLAYMWSFRQDEDWEVAGSFGIFALDAAFSARGQLLGSPQIERERATSVFPLPVFGVHATRHFGDAWTINGDLQYFGVEINDIDGSILDARLTVDWMFRPHIGVFAGLNYVGFRVNSGDSDLSGKVRYEYTSALAGIKLVL
jgi:hypothetical protein